MDGDLWRVIRYVFFYGKTILRFIFKAVVPSDFNYIMQLSRS